MFIPIKEKEESIYLAKKNIDTLSLWRRDLVLNSLDIELTERCNNNCRHCCINLAQDSPLAREKELSTEKIKGILEEAVSLGCMNVRFTGGEPLLREDFEELYIFARKLGLRVIIFTNASLVTPSLASLFRRIPPLNRIEVTLYGLKESSYEAVSRTRGSYAASRRGIGLLEEYGIPFVVKWALLPSNRSEMARFKAWAAGIPWMYKDKPLSCSMFFDLRSRRDDLAKNELIKRLRVSAEDGLRILIKRYGGKEIYIKEMKRFCVKFMRPQGDKLFSCPAGVKRGCVDAYGNLQVCILLRHPECVYDLKDGSLEDALKNFFPKLRQRKALNPDYLSRCARCFLKGLCEQCPAKSWVEHGNLDTPVEYLCRIAHVQARYLGLLKEKEKAWEVEGWQERLS